MLKKYLIKNFTCIISIILIISLFFIFYGRSLNDPIIMVKLLPFFMMSLVFCLFSFYWSLKEFKNRRFIDVCLILTAIFSCLIYIVCEVLAISSFSNENVSNFLYIVAYVFFAISCLMGLILLIYSIIIDIFSYKNHLVEINFDN